MREGGGFAKTHEGMTNGAVGSNHIDDGPLPRLRYKKIVLIHAGASACFGRRTIVSTRPAAITQATPAT